MKKIFLLIVVSMCWVCTEARMLSIDEAKQIAEKFIVERKPFKILSHEKLEFEKLKLAHTFKNENSNLIYVFNKGVEEGFIIVSGDDRVVPILGYSNTGRFDTSDLPSNFLFWLECCEREIQYAIDNDLSLFEASAIDDYAPIEPLITTKWGQRAPYNNHCPINPETGERCVTGCVSTAVAQIMNYYQWPDKGVGEYSYKLKRNDDKEIELYANFGETEYRWDKMLDEYDENSPEESCDAVAELMLHTGVCNRSIYGSDGTVALPQMPNLFYYLKYDFIDKFDKGLIDSTNKKVYEKLSIGCPLLVGAGGRIEETSIGHAFICDGYSGDGYFHINWGWNGNSDGYYLLSALNPSDRNAEFNSDVEFYSFKPIEDVPGKQIYFKGDHLSNLFVKDEQMLKIKCLEGFYPSQAGEQTGYMGLRLTDKDGNISYVESDEIRFHSSEKIESINIPFNRLNYGAYIAIPVFRRSNGDWGDIYWIKDQSANYACYKLYVEEDRAYLGNIFKYETNIELGSVWCEIENLNLYLDESLSVDLSASISLDSGDYCEEDLYIALCSDHSITGNKKVIEKIEIGHVRLIGNEEIEINCKATFSKELIEEETPYYIALCNSRKKILSDYYIVKDSGIEDLQESEGCVELSMNQDCKMLSIKSFKGIKSVSVYSVSAQQMIYSSYNSKDFVQLDISELSSGIYIIKVETETATKTQKIVIME